MTEDRWSGGSEDSAAATETKPKHTDEDEVAEDQPNPGTVKAGTMVVYHLPPDFTKADDPHRCAVVSRVYARVPLSEDASEEEQDEEEDKGPACVDLTVFLAHGDDPGRTYPMLAVVDAQYNPDCPAGTYCLEGDGDDLPTVDDIPHPEQLPAEDQNKSPLKGKGKKDKKAATNPVAPEYAR